MQVNITNAEGADTGKFAITFDQPVIDADGFDTSNLLTGIDTATDACAGIDSIDGNTITFLYGGLLAQPNVAGQRVYKFLSIDGINFGTATASPAEGEII